MADHNTRREFLKQGTALTAGLIAGAATSARGQSPPTLPAPADGVDSPGKGDQPPRPPRPGQADPFRDETPALNEFSRLVPSFGGPPDSDHFLGKLVPGYRAAGLEPVPFQCPDLGNIPFEAKNGVKEFHLVCEPVVRELLPGYHMNFYGFNGSMPGPTIEAVQGDRVRFVVHNELPEPTAIHWHGLELPVQEDGVPNVTQDLIMPGKTYVYEFDLHQAGTFFYHPHVPMQEAFGMAGFFIIHPRVAFDPPVDRDFGLIFQNFQILPANTVADSWGMDWNWHTINGRSGPYTTPLVAKHGERVRIRILNFSPEQHHPIHLHGHTFWVTGHEGTRIPHSAWIPRNNQLIAVAQSADLELIAFNPGDWMLHCHMVHHMMNHMVRQVGPRIREGSSVADYKRDLDDRPAVAFPHADQGHRVPGYPQMMQHQHMSPEQMRKIQGRREVLGMRKMWHMGVHGLMTVLRVLPEDLYTRVMESDESIPEGAIFEEIVRRRENGSG